MIVRDRHNIIVQHSLVDPNYMDGGDSAMRTGIMAWAGSDIDKGLLTQFEVAPGILTRHPYQTPWDNPKNFTRDQLVCYIAGCKEAGLKDVVLRVKENVIKSGYRAQNIEKDVVGSVKEFPDGADIITPDVMLLLDGGSLLRWSFLFLSMCISAIITPLEEQNQLICMLGESPRMLKWYVTLHPDYKKSVRNYWDKRHQPEIAEVIIAKVERILGERR